MKGGSIFFLCVFYLFFFPILACLEGGFYFFCVFLYVFFSNLRVSLRGVLVFFSNLRALGQKASLLIQSGLFGPKTS